MIALVDLLLIAGTALLAVFTLTASASRWWWFCELTTHFRAQYAVLALLSAAALFLRQQLAWSAFAAGVGAVNILSVLPAYGRLTIPERVTSKRSLRALLINVNFRNKAYRNTIDLIHSIDADFVCIVEVNRAWKEHLMRLSHQYPHMQGMSSVSGWGLWLMSKHPFESSNVCRRSFKDIPYVIANLKISGKRVTLLLTHPYAPIFKKYAALRNKQLAALREVILSQRSPVIVLGDFNCTPWSPHFAQLLRMARLRDSRQGFGLQPTWPTWSRFLRIPIDHCLVSSGISVQDRWVGPHVGSDHFPVVVDFSVT